MDIKNKQQQLKKEYKKLAEEKYNEDPHPVNSSGIPSMAAFVNAIKISEDDGDDVFTRDLSSEQKEQSAHELDKYKRPTSEQKLELES